MRSARARTTGQQFDEPRLALNGAGEVGDGNGGLGNRGIFLQLSHDVCLEGKDPQFLDIILQIRRHI